MNQYGSQNLYEVSYLATCGFQILSKSDSGIKATIYFEDTPKLRKAVMDYYNGTGRVSAKKYVDSYRSMKDMVFQR